uniref:Beta-glucosidase n=1 Tax=Dendroctonus ponderosae TaxID=77166 RepID=J3JV79_DENPD|nr:unknown [Dendroctonus ponderosae]
MWKFVAFVAFIASVTCEDVALSNRYFPDNFKFGAATASYQIEGAWNEDGKGEQLWDWYTHTYPDKIRNENNGDIACDSYHKWREDIELLKELGVNHYRLSLSWSRILPNGTVYNINQNGVNYYTKILETLRANNIEPLVTLYHWDLPVVFHEMGGWLNPKIADYFADFARLSFQLFGRYVKTWITINEPQTTCVQGYGTGGKAPGYVHSGDGVYQCAYTNILAHAKAYHIYDEEFRATQNGRVSIVLDSAWAEPGSSELEDEEAARTAMAFSMGLYANPIYNGNWPQVVIDRVGNRSLNEGLPRSRLPQLTPEEIEYIKDTSDFFCLNTYGTYYAQYQNGVNESIGDPNYYSDIGIHTYSDPEWEAVTDWVSLVPWGFRSLLNFVWTEYDGVEEIVVTENGWADVETILEDTQRINYVSQYLSALLDAYYEDGVNVTGYTVWSLLDNFEWTNGYTQKLGIVHVDFDDEERMRTPKSSYSWYKRVLANRCLVEECVRE